MHHRRLTATQHWPFMHEVFSSAHEEQTHLRQVPALSIWPSRDPAWPEIAEVVLLGARSHPHTEGPISHQGLESW